MCSLEFVLLNLAFYLFQQVAQQSVIKNKDPIKFIII